jgi:hypothetical protein
MSTRYGLCSLLGAIIVAMAACGSSAVEAADIFVRFKVTDPPGEKFRVTTGGYIHLANWHLDSQSIEATGGQWSKWIDLRKWPLHGRLDRVGGVAEWPAMSLSVSRANGSGRLQRCTLEVQLADGPDEHAVVLSFVEHGWGDAIAFLLPHPLREKKAEFETGSQMTARHLAWARQATGGHARALKQFDLITSVWGHYDPVLARQAAETLKLLGFNVIAGVPESVLREAGMRTYAATWHLVPDPQQSADLWNQGEGKQIARTMSSTDGRWTYEHMAHYVIADEIQTMDFRQADKGRLNGWFREYLRGKDETDATLGRPLDRVEYPAAAMYAKTLPREADLPTRKIMYHAGKFGQWWSVMQLRQTTNLVKKSFAALPSGMRTETLPSDHAFFNAWGPPHVGMAYRGLDLFEIGGQQAVDIVSAEDWLGLNRMYGPSNTWTGAEAFGFLCGILRSGIADHDVSLRALITPSDSGYLRLKAYSALGQGTKSFFFWTFGPTYIGTENYWSDLRSEYDGIARLTRALEKSESILYPAKPVRDPVAMLYSVSHDMWHTDDPASFVEMRLTWAALRHASVQPDLLREEDVEAGRLAGYKVLYVCGQCLTRRAAAMIDAWVKNGGTAYLSGGAATRDEFYEPHVPPFAATVWPADAAGRFIKESGHAYNERVDLPTIQPLTRAKVVLEGNSFSIPAIGCRMDLKDGLARESIWGTYADGRAAAARTRYGRGTVLAVGFLPGLAYSPFKAGQTTLDEVWPIGPRRILTAAVCDALQQSQRITVSEAGVEASLLSGPAGSAIVLVNHTYKPIARLRIEIPLIHDFATATSTEDVKVTARRVGDGAAIELPLEWTDIVLMPKRGGK